MRPREALGGAEGCHRHGGQASDVTQQTQLWPSGAGSWTAHSSAGLPKSPCLAAKQFSLVSHHSAGLRAGLGLSSPSGHR